MDNRTNVQSVGNETAFQRKACCHTTVRVLRCMQVPDQSACNIMQSWRGSASMQQLAWVENRTWFQSCNLSDCPVKRASPGWRFSERHTWTVLLRERLPGGDAAESFQSQ
eukprot:16442-Heterococcus_DN1.PRE.7